MGTVSRVDLRAFLFIAVPLLAGALWFRANAPSQRDGVYVETAQGIFKINGHDVSVAHSCQLPAEDGVALSDALLAASIVPGEQPTAFYVISQSGETGGSDDCAQLYFFAANNGSPAAIDTLLPLETRTRGVRPRVTRITSDGLVGVELRKQYLQIITRQPGSRATFEGFVALVVRVGLGPTRLYPIRVGPRPRD